MFDPDVRSATFEVATRLYEAGIFPRGVVPVYLPEGGPDPADLSAHDVRAQLDFHAAQLLPMVPASAPKYMMDDLVRGFEDLEEADGE